MKFQVFPPPRHEGEMTGVGGIALLATMAAAEVAENLPAEQARGFFASLGRRMATLAPMEDVEEATALQDRINAFWQDLDWGDIELIVGEDAITVRHHRLPEPVVPDLRHSWQAMLLGVLEGAYDAWFRALGSGPALHTAAQWKDDLLELRHGR